MRDHSDPSCDVACADIDAVAPSLFFLVGLGSVEGHDVYAASSAVSLVKKGKLMRIQIRLPSHRRNGRWTSTMSTSLSLL